MTFKKIVNKTVLNNILSNYTALVSILLIVGFLILAIFSYQFMPDNSPMANNIQLSIAKENPGFKAKILLLKKDSSIVDPTYLNQIFLGKKKNYIEVVVDSCTIFNDTIYYSKYNSMDQTFNKVSIEKAYFNSDGDYIIDKSYLLGTDKYGRDLLSRIILGTRVSFSVGFISVFISVFIGLILGLISGYYGGKIDLFICWLINVVWSIPTLLLVIAISLVLGKGFWQVFVAVGLTMWVEVARVTRGEVLRVSRLPYIEAVKSFGLSDFKIMWKHILPNILNPIIIISAANFATSILLESGLSFLGIGVQPPMPSWGMIIKNHYGFIIMDKAHLALLPAVCIVVLVLSFMILGNSLRDALDVRIRK